MRPYQRGLRIACCLAVACSLAVAGAFAQHRVGLEFQVNTYTVENQSLPVVAIDAAGNFVVAWQSYHQDGQAWGVFARRHDQTGAAQSRAADRAVPRQSALRSLTRARPGR